MCLFCRLTQSVRKRAQTMCNEYLDYLNINCLIVIVLRYGVPFKSTAHLLIIIMVIVILFCESPCIALRHYKVYLAVIET